MCEINSEDRMIETENNFIEIDTNKCKMCYSCVRVCPVTAIKITNGFSEIIQDRCIGCGSCVKVCSQNAITYANSIDKVEDMISSEQKVYALCAPSISGEFEDIQDYRKFVSMIKALGFDFVNEVSFGADLVAYKYLELFHNSKGKCHITANCPVVVSYVEKYHPEMIDNLAAIVSPYIAAASVLRTKYGEDIKIVYIGPCIQAKKEISFYDGIRKVDAVLTFVELRKMFSLHGVTENSVEWSEFDPPIGGKGALFPISRGLLQAVDMNEDLLAGNILVAEGHKDFSEAIKEFEMNPRINQHLNLFSCEGCIMGPGTSSGGKKFVRRSFVLDYARKRMKLIDKKKWKKDIADFLPLDYSRSFIRDDDHRFKKASEEQIHKVLVAIGKADRGDELGCGSCGYSSCRGLAVAICHNFASYEMCLPFMIKKMDGYIRKINTTNEKLTETKQALKKSEELARIEQKMAKEASETTSAMLQKLPSGVIIVNENLRIIEANSSFISMLGEETKKLNEIIPGLVEADLKTLIPFHKMFSSVMMSGRDILNRDVRFDNLLLNVSVFTISKNKIVGAVIRDMTSPQVRKDEVITRANSVIKENLETVQKIAFLLGESASRTEKIMSSIIESHKIGD